MDLITLVALIGEVAALITAVTPLHKQQKRTTENQKLITEGQKCLLRSEILKTYYHHRETKTIRQYEYENFVMLYKAYKCLGGNSFIDKIYDEVKEFEIVS